MSQPSFLNRDAILVWLLRGCASVAAGLVIVIGFFVAWQAFPALQTIAGQRFFTDTTWQPTGDQYGMTPMIAGSIAAVAGALLLTAPLGIGSAVFLRFYARPEISWLYRRVVEVLAGVPSVVYGLWGLTVLVPLIARISPLGQGQSLLAGALILTMMTLPTVIVATDAAIGAVPNDLVRGAAALGLGRRAIVWSVVLPAARGGILTGLILQVGRAIGETMAVLMVCGNVVQLPNSVFQPIRTLTANIALEMGYADGPHRAVLFVSGLLLLCLVSVFVLAAKQLPSSEPAS